MAELRLCTKDLCSRCMYHAGTDAETLNDVHCNYLTVVGHSRIFIKGKMAFPAEYCDKFEEGPTIQLRPFQMKGDIGE